MALNQNQFSMTTLKGTLDSGIGAQLSMTVEVSGGALTPGEFVALVSTVGGNVPKVAAGADEEAKAFGVVLTNPLKDSYAVGEKCEIGILGSVVICEASAAITAGAAVEYVPSTKKVRTQVAGMRVGVAIENAAADASLVRVMVMPGEALPA